MTSSCDVMKGYLVATQRALDQIQSHFLLRHVHALPRHNLPSHTVPPLEWPSQIQSVSYSKDQSKHQEGVELHNLGYGLQDSVPLHSSRPQQHLTANSHDRGTVTHECVWHNAMPGNWRGGPVPALQRAVHMPPPHEPCCQHASCPAVAVTRLATCNATAVRRYLQEQSSSMSNEVTCVPSRERSLLCLCLDSVWLIGNILCSGSGPPVANGERSERGAG